ncbi:DUF2917 domain-containing protein [Anaeromyxobacter paludicola]|uniref:DUF2917 domain-containing protein n=1 Tax=Anaeromyxobacter paludicola TaxID=2918171 RepID=A0ABM7XD91_9BACT|nr:DUF2917 domain-containing protein [Anaeromyxobacter paludicola]BDG09830.1 hypothetical protein AMPC_29430 [Anaeromyxobacter paludicola]
MMNHSHTTQGPSIAPPRAAVTGTVDLDEGKAWSAEGRRHGVAIRCETGTVWITVEGDPEDHVLQAPAVFETHGRGRVAAQALQKSRITVQPN